MRMIQVPGQNKRYHHKYIDMGGQLNTIQALIFLAKLPRYQNDIKKCQVVATSYAEILNNSIIKLITKKERTNVSTQYTIRIQNRDAAQKKLRNVGIPTAVPPPYAIAFSGMLSIIPKA